MEWKDEEEQDGRLEHHSPFFHSSFSGLVLFSSQCGEGGTVEANAWGNHLSQHPEWNGLKEV